MNDKNSNAESSNAIMITTCFTRNYEAVILFLPSDDLSGRGGRGGLGGLGDRPQPPDLAPGPGNDHPPVPGLTSDQVPGNNSILHHPSV